MKEEKYESKVAWRMVGADNWKKGTEKIKEHKKNRSTFGEHGKMTQLQPETTGRSFQEGRHGRPSQKRGRTTTKQGDNVSCMTKWSIQGSQ